MRLISIIFALCGCLFAQVPNTTVPPTIAPMKCDGVNCAIGARVPDTTGGITLDPEYGVAGPGQDNSTRHLLRQWHSKLSKIASGTAGTHTPTIAWISDSWGTSATPGIYATVRTFMSRWGYAGAGYVSVADVVGVYVNPAAAVATTGAWTVRDDGSTPIGSGPDLTDATSTEVGASKTVTSIATDYYIHYLKQPNGAQFRWKVDSGAWTTVDTANATVAHATVAITGQTLASHAIRVEVVDPLSAAAGVTLLGVECDITTLSGVRMHNISRAGARYTEFAAQDATIWAAEMTQLSPDLVVILLATNDLRNAGTPASVATALDTLYARIHATLPLADVLVVTPGDNGGSYSYTMADFVVALRDKARELGLPFFDSFKLLGSYADANTRGLMQDADHPSPAGGEVIGEAIAEYILAGANVAGVDRMTRSYGWGSRALNAASVGAYNTAFGALSLSAATTATYATAIGSMNQWQVTSGGYNTTVGAESLYACTTCSLNVAIGDRSGRGLTTTGNFNTLVGSQAGYPSAANALTTGTYNTFLGYAVGMRSATQRNYLTVIGAQASGDCSNCVVLGRPIDTTNVAKLNVGTEPTCMTATDLVVDGTTNTKVTSASHNFAAADVGARLQVTAGAGWTAGDYYIVSVAANAATLNASPAAVTTANGTWNLNRSLIVTVEGAAGAADTTRQCRKDAANAFAWVALPN